MRKPDLRYWVLWLFLLGIVVIVFLQVISGYNITRLLEGNNSLTTQMQAQNNLHGVETDLLTLESNLADAAISDKATHTDTVLQQLQSITQRAAALQQFFTNNEAHTEAGKINRLVQMAAAFDQQIITALQAGNVSAARNLIATEQGKNIRDSIQASLSNLALQQQAAVATITGSIESTGKSTRIWGFSIAIIALLAVVLAFWYILNQGRQQQKIIKLLNDSDKRNKEVAGMKEQFLANMSHEIRTPMNAILGFTNLLRRSTLSTDQRQYVQNIHSAGENLLALVNDILDLSKIEAGMMSLEETRFSLHSLVSSVGAMFGEKIKEKKLHFETHIDPDVPDVLSGDAVRLTQILVNLLSNAVKFTEAGKIEVYIKVLEQTPEHVRLRICMEDTGIGIPADKQQTIFERFQQAETETTRRFGGTGLGLAIVKQLVTLQKGTIALKSEPGKGSQFIIELGYGVPDIAQLYAAALSAQEDAVALEQITVLIAEDNAMNQQLISHLMKSWSIEFFMVSNGVEVIEELKKKSYSIVLMDIQMPEMDGYIATNIIRNELRLSIPIIAMTAHAMAGEKEKCLQLGMNDYVSKPIKETVLYNMIGQYAQHIVGDPEGEDEKIVDLSYLHRLSGGDVNFEKEILKQFLIQAPEEVSRLQAALDKREWDNIKQTAHSLKSTIGYMGLSDELHPYLDRLERATEQDAEGCTKDDLDYVKRRCEAAFTDVERLLQTHEV